MDDIEQEIAEARGLLQKYEKETDYIKKADLFIDAIGMLNDAFPRANEKQKTYIQRLKLTYTRHLLKNLPVCPRDIHEWLSCLNPLILLVDTEKEQVFIEEPPLRKKYMNFKKSFYEDFKKHIEVE